MKKKFISLFIIVSVFLLTAIAGYSVGARNNMSELPVYENTAVYPAFSLPQLTDTATFIVDAEVVKVGDTFLKEIPLSLTENPEDATESITYPVTPITLAVHSTIKGDNIGNEFIYYENGGITSSYIQLPDGYAMEEGMDVILFLNVGGYSWGAQSIFPIVDGNVILNNMAMEYVDENNVSALETQSLNSNIRSQIDAHSVDVMPVDDFISLIQSIAAE